MSIANKPKAMNFDPYHKWLAIPPAEQPPNHYRLLGVPVFEADKEVIANAANRQMAHVRSCGESKHFDLAQQILNELAQARLALLDLKQRSVYDAELHKTIAARPVTPPPVSPPPPPRVNVRREQVNEFGLGVAPQQSDFEQFFDNLPGARTESPRQNVWDDVDAMPTGRPTPQAQQMASDMPIGYGDIGRWVSQHKMGTAVLLGTAVAFPLNLALQKPLTGLAMALLGAAVASLLVWPKLLVALANFFQLAEEWVGTLIFYGIVAFVCIPGVYAGLKWSGYLPEAIMGPGAANLVVLVGTGLVLIVVGAALLAAVVKLSRGMGLFPATAAVYLASTALVTLAPGSPMSKFSEGREAAVAWLIQAKPVEEAVVESTQPDQPPSPGPIRSSQAKVRPNKSTTSPETPSTPGERVRLPWRPIKDASTPPSSLMPAFQANLASKLSEVRRVCLTAADIAVVLSELKYPGDGPKWRLDRFDVGQQKLINQVGVSQDSDLKDVSLDASLALLVTPDEVEICSLEDGATKATLAISDPKSGIKWASFVDANRCVLLDSNGRLAVWTIAPQVTEVFGVDGVTTAALTPGRNYLIAFRANDPIAAAQAFDVKSGEALGELAQPRPQGEGFDPRICAVNCSSDQIAAQGNDRLHMWDLASGEVTMEVFPAPSCKNLHFVDSSDLLLDGMLLAVQNKKIICRYRLETHGADWNMVVGNVDGYPWVVVTPEPSAPAVLMRAGLRVEQGASLTVESMNEFLKRAEGDKLVGADFGEFSQRYSRERLADLICGDDDALVEYLRWWGSTDSATALRRWGIGVTLESNKIAQPIVSSLYELKKTVGPAGFEVFDKLQERTNQDNFGKWPKLADPRLKRLPLLGGGKMPDLVATARRHGLDMMLVFSIEQKATKSGNALMDRFFRVKIVNLEKPRDVWVSKPLSANAALRDPSLNSALVREVTEKIGERYQAEPLPSLDSAAVKERLRNQLKKIPPNPLQLIAEVRYYQAKQLLTEKETSAVLDRLVGEGNGQLMATGTSDERRGLLEKWLDSE